MMIIMAHAIGGFLENDGGKRVDEGREGWSRLAKDRKREDGEKTSTANMGEKTGMKEGEEKEIQLDVKRCRNSSQTDWKNKR